MLGLLDVWRVEKKTLIGTRAFLMLRAKESYHVIIMLLFHVIDVLLRHHVSLAMIIQKNSARVVLFVLQYFFASLHVIVRTQRRWT